MAVKLFYAKKISGTADCVCIGVLHDRDPQDGVDKGPFLGGRGRIPRGSARSPAFSSDIPATSMINESDKIITHILRVELVFRLIYIH